MPVTFTLPGNGYEAFAMLVPFVTFLLGIAYLTVPRKMLGRSGLEPKLEYPDAVGEGRATYAGMLLAFSMCAMFLQEPQAFQPGLNQSLALAWSISGFGILLQITLDGQREVRSFVHLAFAIVFASIMWWYIEPVSLGLSLGGGWQGFVTAGIALFTLGLGLVALLLPTTALNIMRIKGTDGQAMGLGGPRSMIAGFYAAAGAGYLFISEPVVASIWLQLLLGMVWLMTGLGRTVAMVFDPTFLRGFSRYHVLGTLFELSLGSFLLANVFGVI